MNHTITIEKIIPGGKGLGRLKSGIVVLCPDVLPEETVVVRELKQHRGYLDAELVEILNASVHRTTPSCPYFAQCGGCDFQHIEYQSQLDIKKAIIGETLERSKVKFDLSVLKPVIPSPKPFGYRFRIRLKISPDGSLGYYKTKSNTLVEIDKCMIATDEINAAIAELIRSPLTKDISPYFSEIELIQSPSGNSVHAVFHSDRKSKIPSNVLSKLADSTLSIKHFSQHTGKNCVPIQANSALPHLKQTFECISGKPYSLTWDPDCFSQVNAHQNSNLIEYALLVIGPLRGQKVLDLYCGMGNFSIPLGLMGTKELTCIEINKNSLAWAKTNSSINTIQTSRFIQGDVTQQLNRLVRQKMQFDLIVLDPPRQGVGRKIHLVADLNPNRILYISCDPATLVRDIALLSPRGYSLTSLCPVDMFPQTHHIESVALLEKN